MLRAGKTTLLRLSIFIIAGILFSGYFPSPAEARAEDLARIRVCLAQSLQIQEFEVQGNYDLVDEEGKIISKVAAGENWKVEYVEEGLKFFKGDILELSSKDPVSLLQEGKTITAVSVSGSVGLIVDKNTSVVSSGNQVSFLSGSDSINTISKNGTGSIGFQEELKLVKLLIGGSTQSYRGDLEFRSEGSGIMLVNSLPLEEYLYSVVPGEMPASWQLEALKAQAVAARTYALVKKNSANNNIYDVLPTTANQVYKGYNSENASSSRAVSETRGQVLEYLDQPITAFFHSSSGGFLESSQDVWSTRLEYFEDKPDPYDQNDSHYDWTVNYTQEQLVQQLNKGLFSQQDADSEERLKAVQDIELMEMTSSGARVKKIKISGITLDGKTVEKEIANSERVRAVLGLKSALFTVSKSKDEEGYVSLLEINGSGYGHGIGMSQYGAKGMASKGFGYQEILDFYFNKTQLVSIN